MLIIFDCDGVLRSVSMQAVYEAYLAIAEYLHLNPEDFWKDLGAFRKWFNCDWWVNLGKMGVCKGSDISEIHRIFIGIHDPYVRIFPWTEEVIKELASKNSLALLTSSTSSSARNTLDGLAGYFSLIVGCEEVGNLKPNPEGILLILEKTGARAEESVMIGDTEVDILAGRNAGVRTAGVTWGLRLEDELKKHKPDFILNDPQQLIQISEY